MTGTIDIDLRLDPDSLWGRMEIQEKEPTQDGTFPGSDGMGPVSRQGLCAWVTEAVTVVHQHCPDRFPLRPSVSVFLTHDATVRKLNAQWRRQDHATNVLAFPAGPQDPALQPVAIGDIAVADQTVIAEAKAQKKTWSDHLRHLIVHATLHLLGYDHLTAEDAEVMEALETAVLAKMGIADPYGGDREKDHSGALFSDRLGAPTADSRSRS